MPMDTTFDTHERVLEVREHECEGALVGRMHHLRAIQALLTLTLLHQEVIAAVAVKRQFTASGDTDTLLCAAVGLQFRHTDEGL